MRGTNDFKSSNKQFASNLRQLREIKEVQERVKEQKKQQRRGDGTQHDTIAEEMEDDERAQLLMVDPRDRYLPEVEATVAKKH